MHWKPREEEKKQKQRQRQKYKNKNKDKDKDKGEVQRQKRGPLHRPSPRFLQSSLTLLPSPFSRESSTQNLSSTSPSVFPTPRSLLGANNMDLLWCGKTDLPLPKTSRSVHRFDTRSPRPCRDRGGRIRILSFPSFTLPNRPPPSQDPPDRWRGCQCLWPCLRKPKHLPTQVPIPLLPRMNILLAWIHRRYILKFQEKQWIFEACCSCRLFVLFVSFVSCFCHASSFWTSKEKKRGKMHFQRRGQKGSDIFSFWVCWFLSFYARSLSDFIVFKKGTTPH
mmetsp:Transcript_30133/g.77797  ORF Transcript_30133/g.77797 Transcript_30133/m.77797 type:complete len:279 (-) Transcript_30133:4270-5106(-)